MGGVFPNETTIFIGKTGQVAAELCHTSNAVVGEITNWSLTGGNSEVESIPVIGGFVDKENPKNQYEVSFDVIVSNTAKSTFDRWDAFIYGADITDPANGNYYSSALEPNLTSNRGGSMAIVMNKNGGTPFKVLAFNNIKAVMWEPEMSADDMLKGTITFKFSPTTELGVANLKTSTVATSTVFPTAWS